MLMLLAGIVFLLTCNPLLLTLAAIVSPFKVREQAHVPNILGDYQAYNS